MRAELVTARQAVQLLGDRVRPATIRKWVERGLLVPFAYGEHGAALFLARDVYFADRAARRGKVSLRK